MATRRGRDLRIQYDADDGTQRIVAQRTYRDDADVQISPITPLLLARVQMGVPVERSRLIPRKSLACILFPDNDNGRALMSVIHPYRPGNPALKDHVREVLAFDNGTYSTETVTYTSEGLS